MQDKLVFLKVENLIRCTQPDTYSLMAEEQNSAIISFTY